MTPEERRTALAKLYFALVAKDRFSPDRFHGEDAPFDPWHSLTAIETQYLMALLEKRVFRGMRSKRLRGGERSRRVAFAYRVLKAQHPDASDKTVFEMVVAHYDRQLSARQVRAARDEQRKLDEAFGVAETETAEWLREQPLPEILFDDCADE